MRERKEKNNASRLRYMLSEKIGEKVFEALKKNFDVIKEMSPKEHYLMKKSISRSVLDAFEEMF
jgi:hypothetical protein